MYQPSGLTLATCRLRLIGTLIFALCLCSASDLYAQTDQEKAAQFYKEGIDLYFAEDFGLAITKFRSGYQLDPNAMFLYSMSLCFSKLGNFSEALEQAERARETGGMPPDVTTKNDARLVSFAVLVRSGEFGDRIVAERAKADEVPTCATNADCSDGEVCNMRRGICVAEFPQATKPEPSALFGPLGWAGVGAGAVGIGMLVGGGITSLAVKKNEDRLELVADPNGAEFDAAERDTLINKLDGQKTLGKVLVLGGAGLTVAGAALVVVDLFVLRDGDTEADTTTARLVPIFLPDGGGLAFTARF